MTERIKNYIELVSNNKHREALVIFDSLGGELSREEIKDLYDKVPKSVWELYKTIPEDEEKFEEWLVSNNF